jgi:hypothetical protein
MCCEQVRHGCGRRRVHALDQIVELWIALMTLLNTWVGFRAAGGLPARRGGRPAVLVIMNTAVALCREPNRQRDRRLS